MRKKKTQLVFILGPTAVGKSEFAVELAKRIGGEIISCDSMQVYSGIAIMSQQPPLKLRKKVPHHLIGILSPGKEWNAASFAKKAAKAASNIVLRGHIPIVVGGTGLYARALIKGLFPSSQKDEDLRKRLYLEAEKKGKWKLYDRLLKIDPVYASKIHPNDLRRIVRALEVYELTGKAISEQHKSTRGIESKYEILIFTLNRQRRELYDRINERVERMFASAIVKEVKRLKARKISNTAKAALGYKEISDYIDGKYSREEAKELLKKNTRHYAKRQLTWFSKERGAIQLELGPKKKDSVLISTLARKILRTKTHSTHSI